MTLENAKVGFSTRMSASVFGISTKELESSPMRAAEAWVVLKLGK
jgi:hypothetical protein